MNLRCLIPAAVTASFMTLAPFLCGQSPATVVIDAGHGGYDRGGVPGQRIAEKDKTLDVALRLRRILQAGGYKVIMTRDQDVFVPLGTRVTIANSHRNATFVSIHFNCSTRVGANGIETYYYSGDSAALAASIHRNVVASAPTENRGIRRRGFFVLRRTAIPAVLVECGFLTNPAEARLAQTDGYRQQLAEQIARGIRREPPPFTRPLTASLAAAGQLGPQPFNTDTGANRDFVRADAVRERSSRSHSKHRKSSKSSRRKKTESSDNESDTVSKKATRKKVESSDNESDTASKKATWKKVESSDNDTNTASKKTRKKVESSDNESDTASKKTTRKKAQSSDNGRDTTKETTRKKKTED